MIEEELVAFAEITFPAEVFFVKRCPVFHAAPTTDSQVPAYKAFITNIIFGPGEGSLYFACGQLFYRCFKNVAQLPPRLNKKIAAESIAIVFDNNVLAALFVERANSVSSCDEI